MPALGRPLESVGWLMAGLGAVFGLLMVVPCLVLTFMLGPAGWLLYQGVRRLGPAPKL